MSLTDSKIRNTKPSTSPFKLTDAHGLYLLINPGGSRLWYLKYRFNSKESRIALGPYPQVSLSDARQQRECIRKLLAQKINPAQLRTNERIARSPDKCFKAVALEWHKSRADKKWSADYAARLLASMNNHIFPAIGHLPVTLLKTQHFTTLLKDIEEKGFLEVASRTRQHLCNIMHYAVQRGLVENNPAMYLDGVTAPPAKHHYPALPLEQLPDLFRRISDYRQGRELTRLAVMLTLHLFIRSSELRFARWTEIDFRNKIWTIPATRKVIEKVRYSGRGAKMRTPHIVPLSRQAIALLKQIKYISGHLDLVFPGDHNPYKPMSENTINRALRLMGYDTKTEVCGHGFRTMACSALVESELWSQDAVERQMSHQERNSVRAAYIHKAEHLDARKAMMQWWSDYRAYLNEKATAIQSVVDCGLDTRNAEELPARFMAKIPPVAAHAQQLGIHVSLHHPDDLDNLISQLEQRLQELRGIKAQRLQASRIYQTLQATWPQQHDLVQILRWMDSPLRPALELHYRDYPRKGIKRYLARLFEGKYPTRLQQMNLAAPEDFQHFSLSALPHRQLAALADAGEILSHHPDNLALLELLMQDEPDEQQEENLVNLCADIATLRKQWLRVIRAQQVTAEYQQHYPEGNWCDILRKRFIRQHREMFEAAIGYLWQEQLKRKIELEEVLTHWRALMSNRRSAGYYRWLDKLDEFYRALSLVYPVMATTLVSAWKVAGYRKLDELKGHKPWYLALCDEAGMISLESLVPLLSRSEKAMIVGDPLQIEPIRNLSENLQTQLRERHFADNNTLYERVSPASVTGWHRAAGTLSGRVDDTGNGIILDEHRRCQKPIADLFIRLAGYHGVSVETASPSDRIASAFEKSGGHHLMFYSVEGQKGDMVNTNLDEVYAIEQLLNKLEEAGYDLTADVGIVTPYSNQKSLLIKRLAQRMNHWQKNCIGTVHQFQGVGFEVIIYSPVIFHPLDNPNFQNDAPNMLNVVVSRTKQQFIVVGNHHRLRQAGGYLKVLADTVAEDFLLEQGSQHPNFDSLSQTPRLQRYYRDCEHIAAFSALASRCEQELVIITPWIRRGGKQYQRPELAQLVATQRRGVSVKVYYGYYHQRLDRAEDNDETLIAEYREQLGKDNVIRLTEGTHEKVLMIDGRYIVLGSWNWLSHGYHDSCERSEQFSNAIRHEISAELNDVSLVKELRERLRLE